MVGEGGPLILDNKLQPVWFDPVGTNQLAGNLREQTYQGKPVLTCWQGVISSVGETTSGKFVVVNQHYKKIATIKGQDGWVLSEHDFVISGSDAWVTAYKDIPMDLTPFGGLSNGTLSDSAVQEYDLKTGKLVKTWDALQHIPLSQSQAHPAPVPGVAWDAYHINAIQLNSGGSFLTSFRNTWAAYQVDAAGNIEWTLGGNQKISYYTLPSNAQFQFQHDVQLLPGNTVSLFNDACCSILGKGKFAPPIGPSAALVLKLDNANHTGSLVSSYSRGKKFTSVPWKHAAAVQRQRGDQLGLTAAVLRVSKTGKVLLDAAAQPRRQLPRIRPEVDGHPLLGAQRCGAQVRRQDHRVCELGRLDAGDDVARARRQGRQASRDVVTKSKNDFETAIPLGTLSFKSYKVQALDSKGHVLRTAGPSRRAGSGTRRCRRDIEVAASAVPESWLRAVRVWPVSSLTVRG